MSDLRVKLDYVEAASLINGLRIWLNRLEVMLDEAARNGAGPVPPAVEPAGGQDEHKTTTGTWS